MRKSVAAFAVCCLLSACDGNPFLALIADPDPGPDPEPDPPIITDPDDENYDPEVDSGNGVPIGLARNLQSIEYDSVSKTLTVTILSLDGTPEQVSYTRNPAEEAGLPAGYEAYTIQEDPLDRFFTAVVKESFDGNVRAAAVSDGGQFLRFFSGGYYERDGDFDPPDIAPGPGAGQVSYAGQYVGLDNWSGPPTPLPPGADPSTQPYEPGRVVGNVFINANFSDMTLNGSVFDRVALDSPMALSTLYLIVAPIDPDEGTFFGSVSFINEDGEEQTIGNYGGIFGGANAASVGGVIHIEDFLEDVDLESEDGVFVLSQCGTAGEDIALCAGTAP